jgi:hypothetical protein
VTAPPNLKRRLALAFEFTLPDAQTLTTSILAQRTETWRVTLTSEARAAGSSKVGIGPHGRDFSELSRMSRTDARSIVNTFNRELNNQIDRLYDANPDGDRAYYIRELTVWSDKRAAYKDRQIANQNRATTRTYAQQRFNEENKSGEALYLFAGPPPREPVCAGHFSAGLVDRTYVERNPTPIHINCPHDWEVQVTRIGVPLERIWTG